MNGSYAGECFGRVGDGSRMKGDYIFSFWWRSRFFCGFGIMQDSLPLEDRSKTETPLCSPGGSIILVGGLTSLVASRVCSVVFSRVYLIRCHFSSSCISDVLTLILMSVGC